MDKKQVLFSVSVCDDHTEVIADIGSLKDMAAIATGICGYLVEDQVFMAVFGAALQTLLDNDEFRQSTENASVELPSLDWNEYLKTITKSNKKS